jgi:Protein of unknown function (DUF2723)
MPSPRQSRRASAATPDVPPPSYAAASIAAGLVFALYLATLVPSTAMWDTSEYITAAYVLGIPHPPGNPFFVLLGHVFTLLPIARTVAQRINIMAALTSAISAGIWFLVAERVFAQWLATRWQRLMGAAIAALVGATAFTVWDQSVVNEKVYTVSLLFFAVVAWLTVQWCDEAETPRADRLLVLVAFLIGLGYTNHPAGLLIAPAVAVAVLARRPKAFLDWRLMGKCAAALALGVSPFIVEPIRAAQFPALNEGLVTDCTTKFEVSCTLDRETWTRFRDHVQRKQYGEHEIGERQAPITAQVGMYWMYFKWQWLRDPRGQHAMLQGALAAVFLILTLFGGYAHWKYDRRSFWFFGPMIGTVTLALIVYLNFKYGFSQSPELGDSVQREVRDRDYFYLWSFSALSVWIALGLFYLWETIATALGAAAAASENLFANRAAARGWILSAPLLALALVPLIANIGTAPRREQAATRDIAKDMLDSVEPYGILVTVGDNDLFPLWYAQEVEGVRKDVLVVTTALLGTDWYASELMRRPVYQYDSLAGPGVYRGHVWTKPTQPILRMTMAESRTVPEFTPLSAPVVFHKPGTSLLARIDPAKLEYGGLLRSDVFVLHLIADNTDRPVYLSATDGRYGEQLGLQDHLLTQGLARKVVDAAPVATPDTVRVPGDGWLDTSRSLNLWNSFSARETFAKHHGWTDQASLNMPLLYVLRGYYLSEGLALRAGPGDAARSQMVMQQSASIADAIDFAPLARQPANPSAAQPPPDLPAPNGDRPQGVPVPKTDT